MVKIKFEINGREVKPEDFATSLEKALIKNIEEDIRKKLSSVKCPVHGEYPEVICRGHDLRNLSFEVKGCCQKLIEMVREKFKSNV